MAGGSLKHRMAWLAWGALSLSLRIAVAGAAVVAGAVSADPVSASLPDPAVIPKPASLKREAGQFLLRPTTPIVVPADDADAKRAATLFADLVQRTHGLRLPVVSGATRDGAILMARSAVDVLTSDEREVYVLKAGPSGVVIHAPDARGLMHGATTLWQLIETGKQKDAFSIPAVQIADAPRFEWRGLMLDSARHYQSPEFIKRFIDWMAIHKLNVFHWHLTDDQAWRIEIKKYPKLTSVGAWRVPAGAGPRADIDPATGKPRLYGGYYTQETAREIVRYAAERGITVVPEIEMPGHATAPIVAYPELAAISNPPKEMSSDWGIFPHVYSLDESTFKFLEDVLTEVADVFPGRYIHVGGDEVEKEQWLHSKQGQAKMRELNTTKPVDLQTYFTQRIARFLDSKGKRLVGWDEILEPGLPSKSVVMSWRGLEGAFAAAEKGYDTILSPAPTLYFDNIQSLAPDDPPGRGRVVSLEEVYNFEPMPAKLQPEERKRILGVQGNLWAEHIRTEDRMARMAFPRAAAIAELGWTQARHRNWKDFVRRVAAQVPRYDALKLPHSDAPFVVEAKVEHANGKVNIALSTQTGYGDIRYTTNGSEPTPNSPRYEKPLALPVGTELRAATFDGATKLSRTRPLPLKPELAWQRKSRELKLCSEDIALALEDDAPVQGQRAVFLVDVQSPCWIFPQVDFDKVGSVTAAVGQLPFNFQIGEAVKKVQFQKPETPHGELELRLGNCKGELIARVPLAPAVATQAVTTLPATPIAARSGKHDVCLRFAQTFADPAKDPFWVIDWIRFNKRDATKVAGK
jgi:hexosaminidase